MTTYPGTLDAAFPAAGALSGGFLSTNPHSTLHGDLGSAMNAVEAKVGADASTVTTAMDLLIQRALKKGWWLDAGTWARVGSSSTQFTINRDTSIATGDATCDVGYPIAWSEGTNAYKYGNVASISVSGGVTTVNLAGNSDFAIAAALDAASVNSGFLRGTLIGTNPRPAGFPTWFSYVPGTTGTANVGWSSQPTSSDYRFSYMGRAFTLEWNQAVANTSNSTSTQIGLPTNVVVWASLPQEVRTLWAAAADNGAILTTPGATRCVAGNAFVTCDKVIGTTAGWTASGNKRTSGSITFQV